MKCFIGFLFFVFLLGGVSAQTINKGESIINIGMGVDPFYKVPGKYVYNNYNKIKKSYIGPIVLGYEYILTDKLGIGRIGVGGIIGQSFYNEVYSDGVVENSFHNSRTALIARALYHFDLNVKGLDLYAGVGAGGYINNQKSTVTLPNGTISKSKTNSVTFGHYIFGGVRYFFTNSFGVYGEFGHGLNVVNGGFVFKF